MLKTIGMASFVVVVLSATTVSAAEIDACKYLVVNDFAEDPYGIAKELRTQARARGFVVVSNPSEVPAADTLKACVMLGSWSAGDFSGRLAVRVVDAVGGSLIAEARATAPNWWGIERTVRGGVGKLYSQLKYRG